MARIGDRSWSKPLIQSWREALRIFATGLCMGAADLVPGISGGTVAFILGIYQDLLRSIATIDATALKLLVCGRFRKLSQYVSWRFLLILISGMVIAFITLATCFHFLLHHELYRSYLYAGFMGLVVASVIFCYRKIAPFQYRSIPAFLLGILIAYLLSGAHFQQKTHEQLYHIPIQLDPLSLVFQQIAIKQPYNYDANNSQITDVPQSMLSAMLAKKIISRDTLTIDALTHDRVPVSLLLHEEHGVPFDIWIVVCGAIAVSAMLLPGISGSYILTLLGMYGVILAALVDLVSGFQQLIFDRDAFRIVGSMVLGIVIGALFFSRIVTYLLTRFPQATLAALIGFMIGALHSVWPFWIYRYQLLPLRLHEGPLLEPVRPIIPDLFSMDVLIACCVFCCGIAAVFVIERITQKKIAIQS